MFIQLKRGVSCMLKDKTIIITGGSNGMGKYMAMKFVSEGANVVITGRDLEKLESAKKEIEAYGNTYFDFSNGCS